MTHACHTASCDHQYKLAEKALHNQTFDTISVTQVHMCNSTVTECHNSLDGVSTKAKLRIYLFWTRLQNHAPSAMCVCPFMIAVKLKCDTLAR